MAIYFGTFIVSYLFCWYGERLSNHKKEKKAHVMLALAALVPSVLAGIRDYTIGTDIATYGHWLFIAAQNAKNPITFALSKTSIDFLYSVFVYCTAHIFQAEHWLYFFTGALIYGFTIAGLYRYRKEISISMAWLCYLFLFYGDTLNAMRQCIAIAILVFAFSYFQTGNKLRFTVLAIIAFLFHSTSIVVIVFVGAYVLLEKRNTLTMRAAILAVATIAMFGYTKIVSIAVNFGLLDDKFMRYGEQATSGFSLNPLLVRLPYLFFVVLFYSAFIGKGENRIEKSFADFLILMILMEMLTAEMRIVNATLYRISLYFGMYRCVATGRLLKVLKSNNRMIVMAVIWILLILIWIYQNVLQGNNQIYPFTSELIGL